MISIDNISGKDAAVNSNLIFNITSVTAINNAGEVVPIDGQSDTVSATGAAGINNVNTNQSDLVLYPNPASGIINLTSSQEISGYKIFTPQGEEVSARESINTKQVTIDLGGLAKGIYFLQATIGQKKMTKRFAVIQ